MAGQISNQFPSPKYGHIVIARHGRPALDRNLPPRLGWQAYRMWWRRYEAGGLIDSQMAPDDLMQLAANSAKVFASERRRALETARLAQPNLAAEVSALFNEAPLPPPKIPGKFLPKTWNVLSRAAWLWGHSLDEESLSESRARAKQAALLLDQSALESGNVFVAAHGWFNRMMRPELKQLGWTCAHDGGDAYWSYRTYEKYK